ncbi:MAG: (d)CMP kinase [Rhodobacteraceae bacterium]|nr:(d)CMP kinase [Paracoccaceae bacterium]
MGAFTVAIDGPAAAGKGTIGRFLAERFGFRHMDTGLLYRAVAKKLIDAGGEGEEAVRHIAETLRIEDTECEGLRSDLVSRESSRIAAIPAVRAALLNLQREFARRDGGAVLDGRDIGTVIVPDADVKLFVTASQDVRAGRRYLELARMGVDVSRKQVGEELRKRDKRDSERGLAALRRASDSLLLDTSRLTIEQAASQAIEAVQRRLSTGLDSRPGE